MSAPVLILMSGGVDSAVLLYAAEAEGRNVHALHVGYGQPAGGVELLAARELAEGQGVQLWNVQTQMPSMDAMLAAPGLGGPRVVHARNAVLCSLAVSLAVDLDCSEVWIGCNAADRSDYPDCGKSFIKAMSETAYYATDGKVRVRAPLLDVSKRAILRHAKRLGVPLEKTWSCYTPLKGKPCGSCGSCKVMATAVGEPAKCPHCPGHKEGKTLIRQHHPDCPTWGKWDKQLVTGA